MKRFVVHESRTVHLEWAEIGYHVFRLMYGNRFLTPRLPLTPLHWYDLKHARRVTLRHGDVDWLVLGRESDRLLIIPFKDLNYTMSSREDWAPVPVKWPLLSFHHFYAAATELRGAAPEEGWHKIVEDWEDKKWKEQGPA